MGVFSNCLWDGLLLVKCRVTQLHYQYLLLPCVMRMCVYVCDIRMCVLNYIGCPITREFVAFWGLSVNIANMCSKQKGKGWEHTCTNEYVNKRMAINY